MKVHTEDVPRKERYYIVADSLKKDLTGVDSDNLGPVTFSVLSNAIRMDDTLVSTRAGPTTEGFSTIAAACDGMTSLNTMGTDVREKRKI